MKTLSFSKIAFLCTMVAAATSSAANETISSWTKRPYDKAITSFPYRYKIGQEVEVTSRQFPLLAEWVDWDTLETFLNTNESKSGKLPWWAGSEKNQALEELTRDYLDKRVVEAMQSSTDAEARALIASLTHGLRLTDELLETKRTRLVDADGTDLTGRRESTFEPEKVQPSNGLLGPDGKPLKGGATTKITAESQNGLILPDSDKDPLPSLSATKRNDWIPLNERWNSLPLEQRLRIIDVRLLDGKKQGQLLPSLASEALRSKQTREYLTANSEFQVGRNNISFGRFFKSDKLKALAPLTFTASSELFEFRNYAPSENALVVLEQLAQIATATNVGYVLANPMKASRRDAGYHLHFSVNKEDRPESLEPIVRAWNHMILFKMLDAGVINNFDSSYTSYRSDLGTRGMVRLIDSHHAELREHFTDPASEVAQFMEAVAMPNHDAVQKIYREWTPKVHPEVARFLFFQNPRVFSEIFSNDVFLNAGGHGFSIETVEEWTAKYTADLFADKENEKINTGMLKNLTKYAGYLSPADRKNLDDTLLARLNSRASDKMLAEGNAEPLMLSKKLEELLSSERRVEVVGWKKRALFRYLKSEKTKQDLARGESLPLTTANQFRSVLPEKQREQLYQWQQKKAQKMIEDLFLQSPLEKETDPGSKIKLLFYILNSTNRNIAAENILRHIRGPSIAQRIRSGDDSPLNNVLDAIQYFSPQALEETERWIAQNADAAYGFPVPETFHPTLSTAIRKYLRGSRYYRSPAMMARLSERLMRESRGVLAEFQILDFIIRMAPPGEELRSFLYEQLPLQLQNDPGFEKTLLGSRFPERFKACDRQLRIAKLKSAVEKVKKPYSWLRALLTGKEKVRSCSQVLK
jgi:hypothetical protein